MATPARLAMLPTSLTLPRNSAVKCSSSVWKKNMAVSAAGVACRNNVLCQSQFAALISLLVHP